jgi:hypothetical protein
MIHRQIRARKGEALKIRPGESMAHWTFNVKFPYNTQFIFRSLMFAAREDKNLKLLTQGPTPRHPTLVYGTAPYYPADPSTSGGSRSDLNPHAGSYYLSVITYQGRPIRKTILQSSDGASSSSSSGATPDRDSIEDYHGIGAALVGTLPSKPAASTWWGRPGAFLRTAHSKSKSRHQHSETPDGHGVNSTDGPTRFSTRGLDLARG